MARMAVISFTEAFPIRMAVSVSIYADMGNGLNQTGWLQKAVTFLNILTRPFVTGGCGVLWLQVF